MSRMDSEVYLLDESSREWRKLDKGTSKWLKFSLVVDSITDIALTAIIVVTLVFIQKVPYNATVEIPVNLLLLIMTAAIAAVGVNRRKGFVVKEKQTHKGLGKEGQ